MFIRQPFDLSHLHHRRQGWPESKLYAAGSASSLLLQQVLKFGKLLQGGLFQLDEPDDQPDRIESLRRAPIQFRKDISSPASGPFSDIPSPNESAWAMKEACVAPEDGIGLVQKRKTPQRATIA